MGGPCRDGWGGCGSGVNAGLRKTGQRRGPGTVCGVAEEVAVQMGRPSARGVLWLGTGAVSPGKGDLALPSPG